MLIKEHIDLNQLSKLDYVPASIFRVLLGKLTPFPYPVKFSFDPFLALMEKKIGTGFSKRIKPMLPELKAIEELIHQNPTNKKHQKDLRELLSILMPQLSMKEERIIISPPFTKDYLFETDAMSELFAPKKWNLKIAKNLIAQNSSNLARDAGTVILNEFYGQDLKLQQEQILTFQNVTTKIERHFKMVIQTDFIDIKKSKPLKKLSKKDIDKLLHDLDDEAFWLECFPVENFEFIGFGMGHFIDITDIEVMSNMKDTLVLNATERSPEEYFSFLKSQFQSFLNLPDIEVGMVDFSFSTNRPKLSLSLTGIADIGAFDFTKKVNKDAYQIAYQSQQAVVIDCIRLNQEQHFSATHLALLEQGIKSFILFPLLKKNKETGYILEIGSSQSMSFNSLSLKKLKDIFDLIILGNNSYQQQIYGKVQLFIQQQFTSIHHSVKWKFEQTAMTYLMKSKLPDFNRKIEPIVFKDIFPLYGQADIVSSSTIRNKAIQEDVRTNLTAAKKLIVQWTKHLRFHLLESYLLKIEKYLSHLEHEFYSSDETEIVDLLVKEVHPLLRNLAKEYPKLPKAPLKTYLKLLDPKLDIIYKKRKAYETSVSRLNQTIGNYLQKADDKLQKILPHYFEKYTTDGIEYNIYLGASLLEKRNFSTFFLKDFRIWQLESICKITRMVHQLTPKLPVPLTTAQLIFVYSTSLSIRFMMDEKQFNIDGAYNVRYEILKKRIDKAIVKGTKERLTQSGKIAIVFLLEKDKEEYLDYLNYLIDKNYIEADIEHLVLEKLQGAEGLKALRVKVVTES